MAGAISGLGTTYNLPNYTGELFMLSPQDTPLLSMIGGLTGGRQTESVEFEWETEDMRAAVVNNVQLEGAAAPTGVGRVRANVTNVCEIHQSTINMSWTKLSAFGQKNGTNNGEQNPITDELTHQLDLEIKAVARDVNLSFWSGSYQKPTDNTTARKTRGLLSAITTNVIDNVSTSYGTSASATTATNGTITLTAHGLAVGDTIRPVTVTTNTEIVVGTSYLVSTVPSSSTFTLTKGTSVSGATVTFAGTGALTFQKDAALTSAVVNNLLQGIYTNGGLTESETFTLWCNAYQKRQLTYQFVTNAGYRQEDRNLGGVAVSRIISDFGTLNIALDRQLPADVIVATSTNELSPVFLNKPGDGHFFVKPLALTGANDQVMLYGEIGLAYGAELHHGFVKGLTVGSATGA